MRIDIVVETTTASEKERERALEMARLAATEREATIVRFCGVLRGCEAFHVWYVSPLLQRIMGILAMGSPSVAFKSFRLSRIVTSIIAGFRSLEVTPFFVHRHMHVLLADSAREILHLFPNHRTIHLCN